jgi:hypothetical protein
VNLNATSSAEVQNGGALPQLPIYLYSVVINEPQGQPLPFRRYFSLSDISEMCSGRVYDHVVGIVARTEK